MWNPMGNGGVIRLQPIVSLDSNIRSTFCSIGTPPTHPTESAFLEESMSSAGPNHPTHASRAGHDPDELIERNLKVYHAREEGRRRPSATGSGTPPAAVLLSPA